MPRIKTFVTFFVCLLCATSLAQTTAPTTAPSGGPLVISATSGSATVHPGDTFQLDVVITNNSKDTQKIDVPNIVWAAATDVPVFTIPGWPARAGIGPAVIFRSVAIAPGDSFKRSWTADVSNDAAPGEVAFRVGVPLHRGGEKTWSDPLTVKIVAKEPKVAVANPLYDAWKGQEKKTVKFAREESRSGGAPMPGGGVNTSQTTVTDTCTKVADDHAEIDMAVGDAAAQTLKIAAKLMPDDPELPKVAGKEEVKIGDKTYSCTKYTYYTGSDIEMGRSGQGLRGRVTIWMADDVPGGIVKRDISLTIRVTYHITDTLQPNQ